MKIEEMAVVITLDESLARNSTRLISDETRTYLRDCHDHTIQLVELIPGPEV